MTYELLRLAAENCIAQHQARGECEIDERDRPFRQALFEAGRQPAGRDGVVHDTSHGSGSQSPDADPLPCQIATRLERHGPEYRHCVVNHVAEERIAKVRFIAAKSPVTEEPMADGIDRRSRRTGVSAAVDAALANDPEMRACSNTRRGFIPIYLRQSIASIQACGCKRHTARSLDGTIRRGGQDVQGQVILAVTETRIAGLWKGPSHECA